MLYDFCASHGVPHRKCGKLIVATNESERERLAAVLQAGRDQRRRRSRDHRGRGRQAPGAGARLRRRDALAGNRHHRQPRLHAGAARRPRRPRRHDRVRHADRAPARTARRGWDAAVGGARRAVAALRRGGQFRRARRADAWRARPKVIRPSACRGSCSAKGNYFGFAGRPVFSRLIYPAPVAGGLGVHVTLDLAGRMRFGPDVEWIESENYDVDPARAAVVLRAHPRLLAAACRMARWCRTMPASGRS